MARVLVVDDDDLVTGVLTEFLRRQDFLVRTEGTASAAVDALHEWSPDIVILDLSLPDAPGGVVLDQMRAARPDVPIVVATGSDPGVVGRELHRRGAFTVLGKPFNLGRLVRVLREALPAR